MMTMRNAIVAEARSWLGTPFHHQAMVKGVGVDCAMLVRAVGETLGVLHIDPLQWQTYANYGRAPNPRRMGEALRTFLVPIEPPVTAAWPGDVMWLQWREDLPMHLAILAKDGDRTTMIHALADEGKVVEHGFVAEWPARVVAWFQYPGV